MGLDLKIFPALGTDSHHHALSVIDTSQDSDLYNIIRTCLDIYGENTDQEIIEYNSNKKISEDAYGDPLKWVFAKHLSADLRGYNAQNWENRAMIAYLAEAPDFLRIYIYWC